MKRYTDFLVRRKNLSWLLIPLLLLPILYLAQADSDRRDSRAAPQSLKDPVVRNAIEAIGEGRNTFRFDTFGDEALWGGTLRLHEAIEGAALGGVGPGVSPSAALSLGLKVDVEALPMKLRQQLRREQVNLDDPAVTLALLKLDAVLGVRGSFNA